MKRNIMLMALCLFMPVLWLSGQACAADPDLIIDLDVTDKAQVTQISISHGDMVGTPTVFIKAKIKNVGAQPNQYKTKCDFIGTDHSPGFMISKTKPGQLVTATYPIPSKEMPKKMKIKVEDYSIDD